MDRERGRNIGWGERVKSIWVKEEGRLKKDERYAMWHGWIELKVYIIDKFHAISGKERSESTEPQPVQVQRFRYEMIHSAGPYNPYLYKDYLVPRTYPTNK